MMEFFLVNGFFDRFAGIEEDTDEKSSDSEYYTLEEYLDALNEYRDAEADILINIATIYFEDENINESLNYLEKALAIYDELEYDEKKALVLDIMGDIYYNTEDKRTALEYYKESFKLYSKTDSDNTENIVSKINETEKELKYGVEKPKKVAVKQEKLPAKEVISDDYSKISTKVEEVIGILSGANTYMSYANVENPLEQLTSAYEMSSGIGDNNAGATILMIIGDVSLKDSQPIQALENFKKGLEMFKQNNNQTGEAVAMLLIGTTYYISGQMDVVADNFRKSIELLRKLSDVSGEEKAINLMNAIYEE